MLQSYKVLNQQSYAKENYSIVPIRMEDRYFIMKWRNEQIYHLRQNKQLTKEDQDTYFNTVVASLFDNKHTDQVLFSYLEDQSCIGYGGLVHINRVDKNAEISFIIDTQLEEIAFHKHWGIFLDFISRVAFEDLKLHKIYTYAFDIRPHLYKILEMNGFEKDAVLKDHCFFNGNYRDVIIHRKINYNC